MTTVFQQNFDSSKLKRYRVELHLHFGGSVRLSTLQEIAKAKKFTLTKNNTLEELQQEIAVHLDEPCKDLKSFILKTHRYLPLLIGDSKAIERIAYELVEDQAKENVVYFEVRYGPHFLSNTVKHEFCPNPFPIGQPNSLTPRDVIRAITSGLEKGSRAFQVEVRQILVMLKNISSDFCREVVELAKEHQPLIVGIDIAGDETVGFSQAEIEAFRKAKEYGIHRTVHSGESGPATNIRIAIEDLGAERIGHGYNVLKDKDIYKLVQDKNIHIECCPYSSILTGCVSPKTFIKHPIVQFIEDRVSCSISKDDKTMTQSTLDTEYRLLNEWGLNEMHIVQANINAAKASFLPRQDRDTLVAYIISTISGISFRKLNVFLNDPDSKSVSRPTGLRYLKNS